MENTYYVNYRRIHQDKQMYTGESRLRKHMIDSCFCDMDKGAGVISVEDKKNTKVNIYNYEIQKEVHDDGKFTEIPCGIRWVAA